MDVNDDREEYDMEFRPVLLGSSAVKPPSENKPKPPPPTPVLKKALSLPPPPPPNSPHCSIEYSEEESDQGENYSILVDQMSYLQHKVDNLQSEFAVFRSRQKMRNFGLAALVLGLVYVM
jgi:hypothetical protein